MTASEFTSAGITVEDTPIAVLYAEAALDWIASNTTIVVDKANLSLLPAAAKLFVMRYGDFLSTDATVTSESLGGMSQSFSNEAKYSSIDDLAYDLLGSYMKSQVSFFPAVDRWNNEL